ncbi:MAG: hypothetical protein ABIN91_06635 [Mucilaginibacter sp.]|uniref:hypothetical protein n=1 Tax=Mucilaginibacter sp. TaxID=1882438 RepID=UPI003265520C
MKTTKLLLALAIVFAALSFGFKARAQTMVPVRLYSGSNDVPLWTGSTTWYLTLHNESTNEDIYLQTQYYNLGDDGYFHLGDIPEGTYTVTASYYNSGVSEEWFDYYVNNSGWIYNHHMYSGTDSTLATGVVVSYNISTPDSGLTLYTFTN